MGAYRNLSDGELALQLMANDKDALAEIYMRYWEGLFNYASRLLKDEFKAQDLVHDLFAHLLDHLDTLQINIAINNYLYRAVRNRVINQYSKDQNKQKYVDSLRTFIEKGEFATDEIVLEREMKQRIEKAVSELPPKMRAIFEMSHTGNMSRQEIAQATHVSEGTVKIQMKRARIYLKSKLTSLFF
jgi:RNA polymerase sigma-70 factor (ECF subfamily)